MNECVLLEGARGEGRKEGNKVSRSQRSVTLAPGPSERKEFPSVHCSVKAAGLKFETPAKTL